MKLEVVCGDAARYDAGFCGFPNCGCKIRPAIRDSNLRLLLDYLARCGIEFDTAINVLTGGRLGQTVSLRVATDARKGQAWACMFCRFLDFAVQENHCELQFTQDPAPWTAYLRAGLAFGFGISALAGIAHLAFTAVERDV